MDIFQTGAEQSQTPNSVRLLKDLAFKSSILKFPFEKLLIMTLHEKKQKIS